MTFFEITNEDKELIETACKVLKKNYLDGAYHHTVGCSVRTKFGKIYSGVNCDGIHGSCAEYIALGTALSAGEREFDTIVAVHDKAPNKLFAPCGNCRQLMIEYCPDIKVILNDGNNRIIKVGVRDLLPFAWMPIED